MKIIINGDDFGITCGVNQGVIRAFEDGLLRSASLIPNGEAFDEAAEYARTRPGLDIGVHFCLCDEPALTSVSAIYRGAFSGPVLPSRAALAAGLYSGLVSRKALALELLAQLERVRDAGLSITHADSHQYVHLLPGIFSMSLSLCERFKVPFLRSRPADPASFDAGAGRLLQYGMVKAVSGFSRSVHSSRGVRVDIPSIGFTYSGGGLTVERLEKILSRFSEKDVVELVLHPGSDHGQCREKYGHWAYDWKNDRDLACSPLLAAMLLRLKAQAASFGGIPAGR
ncbi:MAG: ChbG/HpnK family deacetylase [Deltaproteobacteria bacterium]|nr:ChbG/HpnK family deacetylase [Deltaproteobacteria bacterium]